MCYYLSTFYVVSVEFVATLNIVDTMLFKILCPYLQASVYKIFDYLFF